jgi:hypothetical protein
VIVVFSVAESTVSVPSWPESVPPLGAWAARSGSYFFAAAAAASSARAMLRMLRIA